MPCEHGVKLSSTFRMFHLLIVSSAIVSLAIYGRRLPWQNVVAIAAIVLGGTGLLEIVNARSGIPLGKIVFLPPFGAKLFGVLPWPLPIIWLVVLLNSRSVSELILKSWRENPNYGLWLLALSSVLAGFLLFNFQWHGLEIRHDWAFPKKGNGSALLALNARFLLTPVWHILLTVWLINKNPNRPKLDLYPLSVWLLLDLYFGAAALIHRHFIVGSFVLIIGFLIAVLAWNPTGKSAEKSLL
jgi:hypothetical protein